MTTPKQEFGAWLKEQQARGDRVGDLARWYVGDLKVHAVRSQPHQMMLHLRGVHKAGVEQLTVLYEAWQEWWPRKLVRSADESAVLALRRCTAVECIEFADGIDGHCMAHSIRARVNV